MLSQMTVCNPRPEGNVVPIQWSMCRFKVRSVRAVELFYSRAGTILVSLVVCQDWCW